MRFAGIQCVAWSKNRRVPAHFARAQTAESIAKLIAKDAFLKDQLDEIEAQLETPRPDIPKLRILAGQLWDAIRSLAGHCGKLGNAALNGAARATGVTGGTFVMDSLLLNGRPVAFVSRVT